LYALFSSSILREAKRVLTHHLKKLGVELFLEFTMMIQPDLSSQMHSVVNLLLLNHEAFSF
jgi:hypothetical protein